MFKPEVSALSTLTFSESHTDPKYRSTLHEFHAVLAVVFEECFTRDLRWAGATSDHAADGAHSQPRESTPGSRGLERSRHLRGSAGGVEAPLACVDPVRRAIDIGRDCGNLMRGQNLVDVR